MAILKLRQADGSWAEIPALIGPRGKQGNGIKSIAFNDDYTLTIVLEDNTSYTTSSIRGLPGANGITPIKGVDYTDGKDGISATHSWEGTTLNITSASGTSSADLKGEKGDAGYSPKVDVIALEANEFNSGGYSVTISDADGTKYLDILHGTDGKTPVKGIDYVDGKDGVSLTHSWTGTTLSITSASGTSAADLKGEKGDDGFSPKVDVIALEATELNPGGYSITITDAIKTQLLEIVNGVDGKTPIKGIDYVDGTSVTHYWDGTTLHVTSASGTTSADLKGDKGDPGNNGHSIFYTATELSAVEGISTHLSLTDITTNGRTIQVGDFLIGANSVIYSVTVVNENSLMATYAMNAKGAAGADGHAIFYTEQSLDYADSDMGSISLVPITNIVTNDRIIQQGDLIISANGVLGRVSSLNTLGGYSSGSAQIDSIATLSGRTPVKGIDYYTETDKTEIVDAVLATLKTETWEFELDDGTIISKAVRV